MANVVINIPIHATGHIKKLSIYTGFFYTISPFVFYIIAKCGVPIHLAYWTIVFINILTLSITITIVKHCIPVFSTVKLIVRCYMPFIPLIILDSALICFAKSIISESLIRLFLEIVMSCMLISVYAYFIILTASQKEAILKFVKKKCNDVLSSD